MSIFGWLEWPSVIVLAYLLMISVACSSGDEGGAGMVATVHSIAAPRSP